MLDRIPNTMSDIVSDRMPDQISESNVKQIGAETLNNMAPARRWLQNPSGGPRGNTRQQFSKGNRTKPPTQFRSHSIEPTTRSNILWQMDVNRRYCAT